MTKKAYIPTKTNITVEEVEPTVPLKRNYIPVEISCEKCGNLAWYAISSATKIIYSCPACGHDTIIKKETGESDSGTKEKNE